MEQGGHLEDWGKYSTRSVNGPSGKFKVHFYHNEVTGDAYYGRDYKVIFNHQGKWHSEPQPNFIYEEAPTF
jgi:hypothetical protein